MRGRPPPNDRLVQQLIALMAPADVIAREREHALREAQAAQVLVWPEHWHALMLLRALRTQWHWRSEGMAGSARVGLRYEAIRPVLPAVRPMVPAEWIQPWPELLRQLQVLELAALAAWADADA